MTSVSISSLTAMTPEERSTTLDALVREATAPSVATKAALNSRVRVFELRYEMSSEEMRDRVRAGELRETADIADWLFYLEARQSGVSA